MRTSYGIERKDGKRSSNDAFSVDLWVAECQNMQDNPVLLYKPQGEQHTILKADDFCLIIMNKFHRQMLMRFPNIITVDSTHGLNSYDFELTTVMVIDEFNHGFPVAQMFTNRKDTTIQIIFFTTLRDVIGVVKCNIFMSDMADIFFKTWTIVMEGSPEHLYCAWHVDRAWQGNLHKISNKEKKTEVYKILKSLQQDIMEEEKFLAALQNAISYMCNDPQTIAFGEYFNRIYMPTYKKWAYCYRKNSPINTNIK